jgi:NADH-quinone oxidoreductase subunit M
VDLPILSLILWSPLAFAVLLLLVPSEPVGVPRRAAFAFSLVPFLLSLVMLAQFEPRVGTLQLIESVEWMPSLGVRYSLGVDGFSLWLVLLTTLLTPVVLLASWSDIRQRAKEFMAFMLVLEWGMLGALLAIDFFLFFLFWELMLFPMFFVIGIWGGPRRYYATIKFVLFTMAGSALMLVAVLYLVLAHVRTGPLTFDILSLYDTQLSWLEQTLLFWAFAIAFMIKVPMVPLHTWLPDAHTEAPTGGSVDLAGVLLKIGAYGFLRFALPMFPLAAQDAFPVIVGLAVVGIVYGAMVAFPQPDMKRLVAYSSVSHMGFVVLGIYAFNQVGLSGGVLQMVNHGISTSGLFLLIGFMHDRTHTREISDYGGIWAVVPVWASIFLVVMLGSIGLPGTNGFVGEFLVLLGAFHAHPGAGAVAATGVILGAAYMLTMYKHVVFGPLRTPKNAKVPDLTGREVVALAPIVALTLVIGMYPRFFLERIEPTVDQLLSRLERTAATQEVTRREESARPAADLPERASR